ncbi:hypothetical protein MJO28_002643 [Puccinia striiformis f. sp. tritici]|uniref:Uncharacterized protein n=2 Tax=Puccinia striiformis TaxID=27350 RepID=A0A2S4VLK3_9BASI|nr:hypothetical protein MJO28_002643 [Puccinia striiformis f. sp. tritici]POW10416.1 hypothetical protein PSTT_06083 [Puccinia striiformis]
MGKTSQDKQDLLQLDRILNHPYKKPIRHQQAVQPPSQQQLPLQPTTQQHLSPNVPINTKAPIPSFYENLNGQWVLSDNWNLYGLSGSNQRHRPRSLDEASNQAPPSSPAPALIHHASGVNGSPSLQYDTTPVNTTSPSPSSPPSSSSPSPNNTKLYLPAGWNHTSKRGPLYATSVIVVASLLIAVGVLSTVVYLVTRRRARGRRKAQLKEGLLEDPASTKLSPAQIEEGRAANHHQERIKRVKDRVQQKLKELTIIKIHRSPRRGGEQPVARISRISVLTGKPGEPPPPSLIIVGEQARRSTSFASNSSFHCTGERQSSTRRRTRSHRTLSQSDETLASTPGSSTLHTSNGLLAVPNLRKPSTATMTTRNSTFTAAQAIPDPESLATGPIEINTPIEAQSEHEPTANTTRIERAISTTSRGTHRYQPDLEGESIERPMLSIDTVDPVCVTLPTRHQEAGRTSVDPNYRSCREIIRARSSTSCSHQVGRPNLSESLRSPVSLSELHFGIPPLPIEALHLPDQFTVRGRSQSIQPFSLSCRSTIPRTLPDHLPIETSFMSGDPLPPAYSGRATTSTSNNRTSRAFEKQRMTDDDGDHHQIDSPQRQIDHRSHRSPLQEENGNSHGPFVAHVATDDKLVLRTLLSMGSTPTMRSRTMGEKEELFGEGGTTLETGQDDEGTGETSSRNTRRSILDINEEFRPSAPPLLASPEEEGSLPERFETGGYEKAEPMATESINFPILNDDQVGSSDQGMTILPAPPTQFIIRFDPSSSLPIHHPTIFTPTHQDFSSIPTIDAFNQDVHDDILVHPSAPPLNLRPLSSSSTISSSTSNSRHCSQLTQSDPDPDSPRLVTHNQSSLSPPHLEAHSIAPPYVE